LQATVTSHKEHGYNEEFALVLKIVYYLAVYIMYYESWNMVTVKVGKWLH